MTGFKPLLPLGGETVIERQIRLFQSVGVKRPLVVCGHRAGELALVVQEACGVPVENSHFEQGMFSSVAAGVAALDVDVTAFFMLPVDVMLARRDTLMRLAAAHGEHPEMILHPTFAGQRGHPPLIPADLAQGILAWNGQGGLAGFLAEHEDRAFEVPVADEHMLFDVDTDEDYTEALNRFSRHHLPSRAECEALLAVTPNVNGMGVRHSRAVAEVALQLARAVNGKRIDNSLLDLNVVEAAGLLHDIAKGRPDHEREGGRMLAAMGYEAIAPIVAAHRDVEMGPNDTVTEREVVFLADKLIRGQNLVSMHERYQAKIDQYAEDPQAVAAIQGRLSRALTVKAGIEAEMGTSIENVVRQPKGQA